MVSGTSQPWRDEKMEEVDIGARDAFHDEPDAIDNASTEMPQPRPEQWTRQRLVFGVLATIALIGIATTGIIKWMDQTQPERTATVDVNAYLESLQISTAEAFSDDLTPQSQAAKWIAIEDTRQVQIPDPAFVQRYIAAVFFYSLVEPTNIVGLLQERLHLMSEKHECHWHSDWKRRSDGTQLTMGIQCNDKNEITKIIMPTLGLMGEIPPELAYLPSLKELVLDVNHVMGTIPLLPTLTSLSLAYNDLQGTIPTYIGLMTDLEQLVLSENLLSGDLPVEIQHMTNLRRLVVNGNELTDGIRHTFSMVSLEEIYGGFNSFESGFDNDSFQNLVNLQVLDLKNNRLKGPFPDALWTLPALRVVDFHYNDLDGKFHDVPPNANPVLEHLDISINFLGGAIPSSFNQLTKLTLLDVSENRFDKPLPDDLTALSKMETLLLTDNGIGPQPIPTFLKHMTALKHLSLRVTARTGTIPDWLPDKLTNLETLDLDWNHISGSIPSELGELSNMSHLLLNRNWFKGTVPTEVASLPNLDMLMVDNNELEGEIDACQASTLIADCGNPAEGCPNCLSVTMEISCPCCTACCYNGDEHCDMEDWLPQIMTHIKEGDDPASFTIHDKFDPVQ